jgi:hypothetical protein
MIQPLPISFSKLHEKALAEKRLIVSISTRLRQRVWRLLADYNDSVGVQRDPNDRWIDSSDIATEILPKLERRYGVDHLVVSGQSGEVKVDLKGFIAKCDPPYVFDVIQLWYDELPPDRQHSLQQELNLIFEEESCPWCFCERSFFQIDSKFLEERVQAQVHELLNTQNHFGALQEFIEARNDFASADFKGAILNSCKAFESVMQSILGKKGGAAGDLVKELKKVGILDDVPTNLRRDFEAKVLQTVPFLRNTLAGHGQGQQVVSVSRELAELCLHLSGALILFCIRRQLVLSPPPPSPSKAASATVEDDDVPF